MHAVHSLVDGEAWLHNMFTKQLNYLMHRRRFRRLHDGLGNVFADLLPHLAAGDGREAVVEAGADAGVGDLIGIGPEIREASGQRASFSRTTSRP